MKRNPESIEKIMKNEEINLAWQFVKNTGAHIFLTGKAGTGKTTFLRTLKQQVPKRMVVLALLAPPSKHNVQKQDNKL